MTKIVFYSNKGRLIAFEISGHTGLMESGKDILCASISSIAQMAVLGIKDELKLKPFIKVKDGYLKLSLLQKDFDNQGAQLLLKTCLDSLRQVIKHYKKYVILEVKENV